MTEYFLILACAYVVFNAVWTVIFAAGHFRSNKKIEFETEWFRLMAKKLEIDRKMSAVRTDSEWIRHARHQLELDDLRMEREISRNKLFDKEEDSE